MILHHPDEDFLLAMAAGHLPAGQAVVVRAHVESCPDCRARVRALQAIGGAMLERAEPHALAPDALASTLRRIAATPQEPGRAAAIPVHAPSPAWLPADVGWPATLRGCKVTPWRWLGPGRRFARVHVPQDPEGSLLLLGIAPGRSLPPHRHRLLELTHVLCGSFADGRAVFGPGDFDAADCDVHHQPVVQPGGECVCLTWVEGRLRFDGRVAAAVARWVGV